MITTNNTQTYRNIIRQHIGNGTDAKTLARTAKLCYGLNIGTQPFSDELNCMRIEGELIQAGQKDGFIIYKRRMSNEQILKDLGF